MKRNRFLYALAFIMSILAFVFLMMTIALYAYDAIHWVLAYPSGIFFLLTEILSMVVVIKGERACR